MIVGNGLRSTNSDPGYRLALTNLIQKQLQESYYGLDFLQLGAIYDVPSIVRGRTACYSYNDGNFAMSCQSPHFPKGIRKSTEPFAKAYSES